MKVADVMSAHVDFVSKDTKIKDVVLLIFGRGINGVPVCENKKVIGFITEKDILAQFYPSEKEYFEDPFREGNFELMEEKTSEIFSMIAEKVMSTKITAVKADTQLLHAQSLMFVNKVGRLPVIDDKGNLIGIISNGDIFSSLVGDRLAFNEDADYNDWLSKSYYAAVDIEDRLKHEMPDLMKIFSENKVRNVMDIGCGTGDHVIEFARRGIVSNGTDRSLDMIKEAAKRKLKLSKAQMQNAGFYYGEAEPILAKLKTNFDAITFLGNTLSHNPGTFEKLIKISSQYMSSRGVMVLQITNFEKVIKTKKRFLSFGFAKLKNGVEKEYGFLEFYDEPNLKDKTIQKTFAILRSANNRWKWLGVRNSTMAYVTKDSIKRVLEKNGFSKISFYGGSFDGRSWDYLFRKPFKPLESDWLNVVAKR